MHYVVTQPCCADASCVVACPVNCIHPAPGEPGFGSAEMVYIDANSCVGCGACVTACPVSAIKPVTQLTPEQQPFDAINAEYFEVFPHADRTELALVPQQRRLKRPGPSKRMVGRGDGDQRHRPDDHIIDPRHFGRERAADADHGLAVQHQPVREHRLGD